MRNKHQRPKDEVKWVWNPVNEIDKRRCLSKGSPNSKIIASAKDKKREYEYHATKGYRSRMK